MVVASLQVEEIAVAMEVIHPFEDRMRQLHLDKGGTIRVPTDDQVNAFRQKLPDFWSEMVETYGENGVRILKLVSDGKEDCGQT